MHKASFFLPPGLERERFRVVDPLLILCFCGHRASESFAAHSSVCSRITRILGWLAVSLPAPFVTLLPCPFPAKNGAEPPPPATLSRLLI